MVLHHIPLGGRGIGRLLLTPVFGSSYFDQKERHVCMYLER